MDERSLHGKKKGGDGSRPPTKYAIISIKIYYLKKM